MKVEVEITDEMIADLLCSALEGGSNYWYQITSQHAPEEFPFRTSSNKVFPHIDYPMNPGGYLMIKQYVDDDGPGIRKLNRAALERGIRELAAAPAYRHHFLDILKENTDAITGDVFLQFALYGDVLYG